MFRSAFLTIVATVACSTLRAHAACAQQIAAVPPIAEPMADRLEAPAPLLDAASLAARSRFDLDLGAEIEKSYVIPAFEIVTFEFLLNQWNRRMIDEDEYGSDASSIADNLHHGWVIDRDPFDINQLWHPYGGSIYFGFARSAGLNFWESAGYTFLGSALWEVAGETVPPSLNDQISTSIGGTFLGEAFFRVAGCILEGEGEPDGWREGAVAVISPPTAVNRHAFGDRFKQRTDRRDRPVFARVGIGGSLATNVSRGGQSSEVNRNHAVGNFEIDYGLPGRSGTRWTEPFDLFHFEGTLTSSSDAFVENAFVRGLVWGRGYGSGALEGVAGLYGTYCYLSPQLFQLSTTALSLGSTMQWWLTRDVALQGNLLGGVGYGAAGRTADDAVDREYHYGITPQAILGVRLLFGERAMLDVSARDYWVSGAGSSGSGRSENILREQASLTVRIHERHALGLQYDLSRRDVPDAGALQRHQTVQTTSLVYSYLLGNHGSGIAGTR